MPSPGVGDNLIELESQRLARAKRFGDQHRAVDELPIRGEQLDMHEIPSERCQRE
jgi:hypothetical protein